MNCIFCGGETFNVWEPSIVGDGLLECKVCDPRVTMKVTSHTLLSYSILMKYENKDYQMSFFLDRNEPKCSFYRIDYGPYGINHAVVFYLDYIPNITPTNILSKIPTFLTFS
jgi:hypothetical protein